MLGVAIQVINAFFALIAVVGLFGNLLIFYIIFRFSIMKNVSNIYTLTLVIANLVYVCWIPFYLTEEYMGHWPFGVYMCKFHKFSGYVSYTVTNVLVTLISADRYLAICHPSKLNVFETYKFAMLTSILIWPVAAAFRAPLFTYAGINNKTECSIMWPENAKSSWFIVNAVVGFLITSVLILLMYLLVMIRLRKDESSSQQRTVSLHANRATTNLALMIALAYLLCWTSYWFIAVIRRYGEEPENSKTYIFILKISLALGVSYSSINPMLYFILDAKFRKCFNTIFGIRSARIRRITTDAMNMELAKEAVETANSDNSNS
ncbi:somatostatin receptor type 2-like protein [Dinothrombium tinctorium]|uniref:Somatostatin receptor type 2-like protein n=1 Tax=Dinothrombium tinctorium TaxID=1965070 RepID=A0A3S3Q9H0_9ACAR|nr:somatostatin receptor type 2-like protein [Dinothrombium tinctorium]